MRTANGINGITKTCLLKIYRRAGGGPSCGRVGGGPSGGRPFARCFCAVFLVACLFAFTSCDISIVQESILPLLTGAQGAAGGAGTPSGNIVFTEKTPYDEDTFVIVNTTSDVYSAADRTSARLTQLLFNEPAYVLEESGRWYRLLVDGETEGWSSDRNFDDDWTCIDGRRYSGRIVITDREKQVYSHPRNGIVIRDVGMGTELFVVNKSDNVYQVALPGNLTGWVSETGAFQLDVGEKIKKTSAEIFAQSCEKFRGVSYLLGGLSFQGIDGAGIVYIAAKVNGVPLPRGFEGQFGEGELTGGGFGSLAVGDVLFFSINNQSSEITDSGVYTGDGKFIHANQHTGKVQYEDIEDLYFQQRLLGVKRYF